MGRLGDPESSLDEGKLPNATRHRPRNQHVKTDQWIGGFEPSPHGRFIGFVVFHHGWFVSGFCECFCGGIHHPFPRNGRSVQ